MADAVNMVHVSTRRHRQQQFRRRMENTVTSPATVTSRSPQRPSDVVMQTPSTPPDAVRAAVTAARAAGMQWSREPASRRAEALDAAADRLAAASDELTALVVREVGKPIGEARAEISRGVAILRYFAQQAYAPTGATHAPSTHGLLFSQRRPHGVAGLITPWNFPVAIPLWKAAPALAFGNAVVLKPSPAATATATHVMTILADALPERLCRLVPGDAETGAALAQAADCVSFTGSATVGKQVARAAVASGAPAQTEMGGQNASIVLPDADPLSAARHVATSAFSYAGQKCTATRRIIVVGNNNAFIDAFIAIVEELTLGDPADSSTMVGPVINEFAQGTVLHAAAHATRDGGRILTGGGAPYGEGWYVSPTVVDGLAPDHDLCREEVFGPICTLLRVPDEQAALRIANSVRYGLVTGIYTRDLDRALDLVDGIDTGLVKVNAATTGVDFYLPFGGTKDSSSGPREQGTAAQEFYTQLRTVTISPSSG